MDKKIFKPIKKDELASLVERQIKSSVGYYDSKLSKEREKVLDYYNAILPKPTHPSQSKYVSMDVYDSVESLKAVLLETFAAGNRIVQFDPQGEDDVETAQVQTDYCDFVVNRQNSGYKIYSDVIQDGLMARVGVAKIYWDEQLEECEEEFSNITSDELDVLYADDSIIEIEAEMNEVTGLYDGELTRQINKSQVRIDVVPPEEFLITPQAKSIQDAPFVAHRTSKSISDLIEEGYDPELVAKIGPGGDEAELTTDPEVLARFESIGADRLNLEDNGQEQSRKVIVYECYVYLDKEGTGKTSLYKIVKVNSVVLDEEEVDKKPFIDFVPLPIPHSFYGSNYAAKVIPTQNARTTLVRGILDHTVSTNNPRYQVVKGSLTNPKELIENRFGGIVNVTRPDGISPLTQASLNPFVFQTIQLLDEDKEEATGVSKLSQGMNKDAISKQNSQGSLENLVSLSQQREKIIARNFANGFLKPLYLEVYRLVTAHEVGEKIIKVAGSFQRVLPSTWEERTDAIVEMKLGYGEQEKESEKFVALHQFLSTDPGLSALYGPDKKYNMAKTIMEKAGIKNIDSFLMKPEELQPPQPDPMAVKQMELEERKVVTQEKVAENSGKKVEFNAQLESQRIEIDRLKYELEKLLGMQEAERKDFDVASKAAIAVQEMEIAKQAPDEQVRAIVSPN
jgi:hypothetical protein